MFLAHLPAGYLVSKLLKQHARKHHISWNLFLTLGLTASILPDLDLFYFYLLDHRQHPHHAYWTHIPAYWLVLYIATTTVFTLQKNNRMIFTSHFIFSNIIVHIVLDSVAGGIMWLYPVATEFYSLFKIMPLYHWWILNYMLHWTFLLEILIILTALMVFGLSKTRLVCKKKAP